MPQPELEAKVKSISRILTDFIKVIKVVSVYPENNPLPAKLKETFAERFVDLISEEDGLIFSVAQGKLFWREELVYQDRGPDDVLADIFHGAGITELTFGRKFSHPQVYQLFGVMKAFINREPGASDLVALLWQTQIAGFDYCTVEDFILREYDGGIQIQEKRDKDDSFISAAGDSGKVIYESIFLPDDDHEAVLSAPATKGQVEASFFQTAERIAEKQMGFNPAPARSSRSLPDTTMILNDAFAMDHLDTAKVESMLRLDAEFDPYRATIELLADVINQESELAELNETLTTIEKIQSEFLRLGRLDLAGEILDRLKELGKTSRGDRGRLQENIKNAVVLAGSREKLAGLIRVLNENAAIPGEALEEYLARFGWEALGAMAGLLGDLEHRQHREAVCRHLGRTGKEHVDIIAQGIFDRRWFVVRNTVSILVTIGGDKAYSYMEKALGHDEPRVRMEAIKGLSTATDARAVDLLVRLVWDNDAVICQAALEALLGMPEGALLNAVTTIINDDRFAQQVERDTQEQLLIVFSKLGGEQAAVYLGTLISGWGFFKNRVDEFYARVAFRALGFNGSEKAEKILLKYSHSWQRGWRRMASEALANRRQIKYGAS